MGLLEQADSGGRPSRQSERRHDDFGTQLGGVTASREVMKLGHGQAACPPDPHIRR